MVWKRLGVGVVGGVKWFQLPRACSAYWIWMGSCCRCWVMHKKEVDCDEEAGTWNCVAFSFMAGFACFMKLQETYRRHVPLPLGHGVVFYRCQTLTMRCFHGIAVIIGSGGGGCIAEQSARFRIFFAVLSICRLSGSGEVWPPTLT